LANDTEWLCEQDDAGVENAIRIGKPNAKAKPAVRGEIPVNSCHGQQAVRREAKMSQILRKAGATGLTVCAAAIRIMPS
jgi:hypothetical protein